MRPLNPGRLQSGNRLWRFPFDMAKSFADQGADWIHMVDLDGAKEGVRINDSYVIKAASELGARIQIGGGIRTERDIAHYLDNGVERVILGSTAVSDPDFTKDMIRKYGSHIAIGIDAKDGRVATHGWLQTSGTLAIDLGKLLADAGAEIFIVTDIATDGMLSGPNVKGILAMAEATGKKVIASGALVPWKTLSPSKNMKLKELQGQSLARRFIRIALL